MANQYAAQVPASQVGSYFVQQYYQMFQLQRDYLHQFYNESSTMVRVDGEIIESASDMETIHQLLISLNFTGIEIKTINSRESWNGGVLVVVSGFVKLVNINGLRSFVQTFFLAPQDKGYFVLNDMFHFAGEVIHQASAQVPAQEHHVDYHQTTTSHLPDPQVSEYAVEEEYVHTEVDEPVQEYSYHEEHQQQHNERELEPEFEPEAYTQQEVETSYEEPNHWPQSTVTTVQEPQLSVEEPTGEPEKLSYASILRAKGKSPPSVNSQPAFTQRPPAADWNHVAYQPSPQQSTPNIPNYGADVMEKALSSHEGESKSVYVRNLPSTITSLEILQAFQNFGKITHDGVFLKDVADSGVCYAFVEFEDVKSVHNALQASPIQLAGRNVYIEERRPNSSASRGGRGGGRGRGRGGRFYGK